MEIDEVEKNKTIANYSENFWKYRITLTCNTFLDIPYDIGQNASRYQATVGHKINHSFSSANARVTLYDSARFGIVNAIATRQDKTILKGDELFLHYGYTYHAGPSWYKQLFRDFIFSRGTSDTGRGCRFNDNMVCDPVRKTKTKRP